MAPSSTYRFAPIVNLASSGFCQIVGVGAALAATQLKLDIATSIVAQGTAAFLVSCFLSLPLSWRIANLLVGPAAVLYSLNNLPPIFLLIAALILGIIHLPTFWTGVPYYPTSKVAYTEILALLPADKPFRFIDLGCGFGPLLLFLAKSRPLGNFVGSEISLLPFLLAWLRTKLIARSRISIVYRSFWEISLADFDVVYAFLAPGPMERLWGKASGEMRPGAIFITNTFVVPAKPQKVIELGDERGCVLYIHEMERSASSVKKG